MKFVSVVLVFTVNLNIRAVVSDRSSKERHQVEDTQPASIIRKSVFEPFYAAVNDKSDGRAHKSDAN